MSKRSDIARRKIRGLKRELKRQQEQNKVLLANGDFYTTYGLAILSLSNPETNEICLQLASKVPNGVLLYECFRDLHHQESLWEPTLPQHSLTRLLENWKYYVSNQSDLPNDFLMSSFKQIARRTSEYKPTAIKPKVN
jgi:hypothetical protein